MRRFASNLLVWYGVLGGGLAWLIQFVVDLNFTWDKCLHGNPGLSVHDWVLGLSLGALVVAIGATTVAVSLYRRSRQVAAVVAHELEGKGSAPPVGRVASLAMMGMCVNFVSLVLIVMTAISVPLLPACQQA
jgi:hypothetical protein